MSSPVVPLSRLTRRDAHRAGTKAAMLGELLGLGFIVPDGFVVTADLRQSELAAAKHTIAEAWRELTGGPVAVRSSAVDEDGSEMSHAGQYESVLGVETLDALIHAIERCRRSAAAERVSTYRSGRGVSTAGEMAVLVQRQVPAEAAGIAFTANPVTGSRSEVVIDSVLGLGERAASGETTPEHWVVTGEGTTQTPSSPTGAITQDQAVAIAELARRVEEHFEEPQDIEWAIADGEVYLLQARPITVLPGPPVAQVPVRVEVPDGYWQRDASHAPKPNTPMFRSLVFPHLNRAGRAWFDEYGFLSEGMEWREIGGWQYISVRPLGGKERKPPPPWLMPLLIRLVPPLRRRVKDCVGAIRTDKPGRNIDLWYEEWKPSLRRRAESLLEVSLDSLSDTDLDEHLAAVSELVGDALTIHFVLHGAVFLSLGELVCIGGDLLGWGDTETLEMLSGLSETSTEPAIKLTELARWVAADSSLTDIFNEAGVVTSEDLLEVDPSFAAAFDDYCRNYGRRALRYEVVDRTFAETPELLIRLIRDQAMVGFDPEVTASTLQSVSGERVEQARTVLAERGEDLERFEQALKRARAAYPVREDNEFFTISLPLGVVRIAVLELGRRLADRAQIDDRDDVFYLEFDEARDGLVSPRDFRDLVRLRKGERAWVEAHSGPSSYGTDPGPPPSFAALPKEARFAMEALSWAVSRTFETERSGQQQPRKDHLVGIAASPGRYTGPVRLVMDETQFGKIQPGDVLVCPVTSPVWSVLFPSVGALVADTGGVLSHPAIIAREYRIPAVVATGNATRLLGDGQLVTVDGSRGTVEVGVQS